MKSRGNNEQRSQFTFFDCQIILMDYHLREIAKVVENLKRPYFSEILL